jgi:hypothetical protein
MKVITPLEKSSGTDSGVSSLTHGERSLADQAVDIFTEKYEEGHALAPLLPSCPGLPHYVRST